MHAMSVLQPELITVMNVQQIIMNIQELVIKLVLINIMETTHMSAKVVIVPVIIVMVLMIMNVLLATRTFI